MEGKVAALGNSDFVLPFRAMGLDTFAVSVEAGSVSEAAEKIVREKYSLVVVAENIASMAQPAFDRTSTQAMPCVVVTPFTTESQGFATKSLGRLLKVATGINILENE